MESGDEDDAFTMGEREWQKMQRNLSKQGLRDGTTDGREKGLQETFEKTVAIALKYSLKIGQLVGMIEYRLAVSDDKSTTEKLKLILAQLNAERDQCNVEIVQSDVQIEGLEDLWERRFQKLLTTVQKLDDSLSLN